MPRLPSPKYLPSLRKITDLRSRDLYNSRALVRVDADVEIMSGKIRDLTRLNRMAETVMYLSKRGAIVILVSHRGRPTGREKEFSLLPLVRPLRKILGRPIHFLPMSIWSDRLPQALQSLAPGQIAMLENIRYEPGETENSPKLAYRLSRLGDLVVNEAFADSHRQHASIAGIRAYLPVYAGFGLMHELKALAKHLSRPKHPYVAVIGGAKISTKLNLIRQLLKTSDGVLLGGALANTVLKAEGIAVGASLIESALLTATRGLHTTDSHLHIPVDVIVQRSSNSRPHTRAVGKVRPGERIVDIGPDTVELFMRVLKTARTVVWNGPMGIYERPPFDHGTNEIAKGISRLAATTVAGGGETIDSIKRQKLERQFTYLSTGGGAMLEWLEGKRLPGVEACMK